MSTIEERLEELMDDVDCAIAGGIPYSEDSFVITARAAIADPWNTAVDLLRYAAAMHIYCRMDYFRCDICQRAAQSAPAISHESYCFVGKLRAHIAKMEGTE